MLKVDSPRSALLYHLDYVDNSWIYICYKVTVVGVNLVLGHAHEFQLWNDTVPQV